METFTLRTRTSDPYVVLEAVGDLDLQTQGAFEDAIVRQLASSSVVVDLSGVEFLAISALRSLMVCHGMADAEGRELVYAAPSRQASRLLAVAGLDEVLPVQPCVPETRVAGQSAVSSSPCPSTTANESVR